MGELVREVELVEEVAAFPVGFDCGLGRKSRPNAAAPTTAAVAAYFKKRRRFKRGQCAIMSGPVLYVLQMGLVFTCRLAQDPLLHLSALD